MSNQKNRLSEVMEHLPDSRVEMDQWRKTVFGRGEVSTKKEWIAFCSLLEDSAETPGTEDLGSRLPLAKVVSSRKERSMKASPNLLTFEDVTPVLSGGEK